MTSTLPLSPESRGAVAGRGRLGGRRVLVVGAGTRSSDEPDPPIGNGRAISVLAAREGARWRVRMPTPPQHAVRSNTSSGKAAAASCWSPTSPTPQRARPSWRKRVEQLGGLDGVVCNVGIAAGLRLEGTTPEAWDYTFAVNLRSHFLLAKAALPRLTDGGSIVFIASVAGLVPGSLMPAYDASKAGLFGLCRHVALEGARRGVRANVVVPGLIDTPLGRLASRGRPSRDRTPVPLGRQGTGWEVAYPTIFLLSPEASYITGQSLSSMVG